MAKGKIDFEKIILIGGSAGSLDVLLGILPSLRRGFRHPIVIVLHRKIANDPVLTNLLSAKTSLKIKEIEEKEQISCGWVYIAPGDYHILFEKDHTISLDDSEKVNYSRPSIDVAFESAAGIFGAALTALLLSGANMDGTEGLKCIKKLGGTTIAQDPVSAEVALMPDNAIQSGAVDLVLGIDEMITYLNRL